MRGSGDECVDLMFFLPVCLISFIGCGCARSPDVVSSLVSCVRPVGRLVLSIRSSFAACSYRSYSSRRASRSASRRASRFLISSRPIPCRHPSVLSCCLVVPSCLPVSFFFSFVLSSCGYGMRCSCVGGLPYHPDGCGYATRFLRLVLPLLVRSVGRCAVSVPVLRHPVMRRREDGKVWVRTAR